MPGAEISVYFATFDQKGWVDLLNHVIKDKPVALSVSWGSAEDSSDWSDAARAAINERLNAAAALGITICGASGDDGTGDEETDGNSHVDFPSCSPFVLAVGGTMFAEKAGKFTEQAWREGHGKRTSNGGGATGGGVSVIFDRPKWQNVKVKSLNKGRRMAASCRTSRRWPALPGTIWCSAAKTPMAAAPARPRRYWRR